MNAKQANRAAQFDARVAIADAAIERHRLRVALSQFRHPTDHPRDYVELGRALREAEEAENQAVEEWLRIKGEEPTE